MLKKIGLLFFVLLVLGLIIMSIIRKPKQIKMTTVKESYNCLASKNEDYVLDINILINQKNSYITNLKEINHAYIGNDDDLYKVEVKAIEYGYKTKIEVEEYHLYSFNIHLNLEFDIEIENAAFIVYYLNQKEIAIDIGSISLYKVVNDDYYDLSITNLKGIINEIANKKTLVGIVFEIKNNTNETLIINNIFLFNINTFITGIYEIGDKEIGYTDNISNIIDKEYHLDDKEITVNKEVESTKKYILTLGYKNHYQIPNLGFKIDYSVKSFNREYVFTSFTFFNDHRRNIPINELEFYMYEHN